MGFPADVHLRPNCSKTAWDCEPAAENRSEVYIKMATIRFEGDEREVPDGSSVQKVCEELGMPFGCTEGLCGTCLCVVREGADNLEPLNEKEEDMEMEADERLACQCIIKAGLVEFKVE